MSLHPLARVALRPLSLLYGGASRARVWLYLQQLFKQHRLPQLVVSVGNLTVGGTGKTPMVLWLAGRLLSEGKRVGILSRGYKGLGIRNNARPAEMSDEVRLLGERLGGKVPIGVGANRLAEARRLEKEGIEWFLLDDGFQHLKLARDVDIVLVDATNPFGGGLLPAGLLREPLSALKRSDILVITRSEAALDIEEQLRRYTPAPVFYGQTKLESILPVPSSPASASSLSTPGNAKFFAFCGIGNPAGFQRDLSESWGFHLVGVKYFRDHHRYSLGDLRAIESDARSSGADALVCTEKDIYNLPAQKFDSLPVYYCRISLRLNDPDKFWQTILATVERRRSGGAR